LKANQKFLSRVKNPLKMNFEKNNKNILKTLQLKESRPNLKD
jgi:hypothetical protein